MQRAGIGAFAFSDGQLVPTSKIPPPDADRNPGFSACAPAAIVGISLAMPAQSQEIGMLIGKGAMADVFAWGENRVIKLFLRELPLSKVEQEFRAARSVAASGLPVPSVFEMAEVEGRHGIVFERLHGASMLAQVQARPWKLCWAARQLAELHAHVHSRAGPGDLPTFREILRRRITANSKASEHAHSEALGELEKLADGEALCHGDFHPDNILFTEGGVSIIDWSGASRGDPIGDVACTCHLIQNASLPPWTPRYMHLLLTISRRLLHATYLKRYFELRPGGRDQIAAWLPVLAKAAEYWGTLPGRQNNPGRSRPKEDSNSSGFAAPH